jgi:predicted amidohydrolase
MYSNGYARFDRMDSAAFQHWRKGAHSPDSNFIQRFRVAARTHQIYVVATFLETADPKPFNSALLIDPNGHTVLHHRKVYICDFDSPESACDRGKRFSVGEIETVAGVVKLGLMICMDREYPEAARSLSGGGAEIAWVPNCCDLATDPVVSDVRIAQIRGRAFETVMGIAVANYPKPRCDGHSFATDPTGAVIAMADDSSGLTIAAFDLPLIRKMRVEDQFRWRLR